MELIKNNKFSPISKKEMEIISGGKKRLDRIECITSLDVNGAAVLVATIRHYQHEFLGRTWWSEKSDKDGDDCNCGFNCIE